MVDRSSKRRETFTFTLKSSNIAQLIYSLKNQRYSASPHSNISSFIECTIDVDLR